MVVQNRSRESLPVDQFLGLKGDELDKCYNPDNIPELSAGLREFQTALSQGKQVGPYEIQSAAGGFRGKWQLSVEGNRVVVKHFTELQEWTKPPSSENDKEFFPLCGWLSTLVLLAAIMLFFTISGIREKRGDTRVLKAMEDNDGQGVFEMLKEGASDVAEGATRGLGNMAGATRNMAEGATRGLGNIADGATRGLGNMAQGATDVASDVADRAAHFFGLDGEEDESDESDRGIEIEDIEENFKAQISEKSDQLAKLSADLTSLEEGKDGWSSPEKKELFNRVNKMERDVGDIKKSLDKNFQALQKKMDTMIRKQK